jgi:hypothetical protein
MQAPRGKGDIAPTQFLTLALDGGESASHPGWALPPGMDAHPLDRRLGGPHLLLINTIYTKVLQTNIRRMNKC